MAASSINTAFRQMRSSSVPTVQIAGVQKHFGARKALWPIDLSVSSGSVFGLLGANGGGKSTLLNIIAGLEDADSGSLDFWGQTYSAHKTELAHEIGYMAQSFALYSTLTVRENIGFRAELYDLENVKATTQCTIETYGLLEFSDTRAGALSGGWARMVQLAASLVHRPALVLLDEPTAGLDAEARRTVWKHIRRLANDGAAVIIATHDMADADLCDQIVYLSDGQVLGSGTPKDIVRSAFAAKFQILQNYDSNLAALRQRGIVFREDYSAPSNVILTEQTALAFIDERDICFDSSDISLEEASIILKLVAEKEKSAMGRAS